MTQTVLVKSARLLDPLKPELQDRHAILVEGDTIREVSDRPIAARGTRRAGHRRRRQDRDSRPDRLARASGRREYDLQSLANQPNVLVTLHSVDCLLGQGERIPLVMKAGLVEFGAL